MEFIFITFYSTYTIILQNNTFVATTHRIPLLQQPSGVSCCNNPCDSRSRDSQISTACGGASAASTQELFYRGYSCCNNPAEYPAATTHVILGQGILR